MPRYLVPAFSGLLLATIGCSEEVSPRGQADQGISDAGWSDLVVAGDQTIADQAAADQDVTDLATAADRPAAEQGAGDAPSSGAPPFFFDDLASGDFSNTMGGFSWQPNGGVTVASDHGRGDDRSLRFTFGPNPSGQDSKAELRFSLGRQLAELWIEFDIYYPDGDEGLGSARYFHRDDVSSDNNKFLRLWNGQYEDSYHYGCSTLPTSSGSGSGNSMLYNEYSAPGKPTGGYNSGGVKPFVTDADPGTMQRGKWAQMRIHFRMATAANNDGLMEWWINGQRVYQRTDLPIYPGDAAENHVDRGYLLGWANSGFADLTYIYIDNTKFFDTDPGW